MTRLVAIDASSWWGGIALAESTDRPGETRTVAEVGLWVRTTHTAHQLALLERLLEEAGWDRDGIDAYAATRGPGSFTGIRVGLATVRGLALGAGRPCYGITTLAAMAEAFGPAEAPRVPLLDAGRGEVFGACYDPGSSPPVQRREPWVGPASLALEAETAFVAFGPGAALLESPGGAGARYRIGRGPTSIAAAAGRLALLRIEAGAPDGEGLSPLYLRPPDAELKTAARKRR